MACEDTTNIKACLDSICDDAALMDSVITGDPGESVPIPGTSPAISLPTLATQLLRIPTENAANLAALRLIDHTELALVQVLGHTNAGDGGGDYFYWDAAETADDDNIKVVAETGYVGDGRWKRLSPPRIWRVEEGGVNPENSRATNDTNLAALIQAVDDSITRDVQNYPECGGSVIKFSAGRYKISATPYVKQSHVMVIGAGPSHTMIDSTASGPVFAIEPDDLDVGAPLLQGTAIAEMALKGDGVNTTAALSMKKVHLLGIHVTNLSLLDFGIYGLYLYQVWNGVGFKNLYINDRVESRTGPQYGVYAEYNLNNVSFETCNIQGLSAASDDTLGFYLEAPDNCRVVGCTVKKCFKFMWVRRPSDAPSNALGVTIDGVYCEPNDAATSNPASTYWFKADGNTASKVVKNIIIRNAKCGWGHDGLMDVDLFDLKNIEGLTIEHCTLKANSAGTVNHFTINGAKSIRVYDNNTFSPQIAGNALNDGDMTIDGDKDAVEVLRRNLTIPAHMMHAGAGTEVAVIGADDTEYATVIKFPETEDISYAHVVVPIPLDFPGGDQFYARLLYTGSATGAGNYKIGMTVKELMVGSSLTTADTMIYKTDLTEPPSTMEIMKESAGVWGGDIPRHGLVRMTVARDTLAGGDTANSDFYLIGIQLWTRKLLHEVDGGSRYF